MTDWSQKIVELMRLKERINSFDVDKFFPYTLPAVAASERQLDVFQKDNRIALDSRHRSFLKFADGWRAFFETQDLLTLEQLGHGQHRDVFTTWIDSAPPQALAEGYSSKTLLPIAVDLEMPHFAAMPIFEGQVQHQVLVLDPTGILDVHESFDEYFELVIALTKLNLEDFESGAYHL